MRQTVWRSDALRSLDHIKPSNLTLRQQDTTPAISPFDSSRKKLAEIMAPKDNDPHVQLTLHDAEANVPENDIDGNDSGPGCRRLGQPHSVQTQEKVLETPRDLISKGTNRDEEQADHQQNDGLESGGKAGSTLDDQSGSRSQPGKLQEPVLKDIAGDIEPRNRLGNTNDPVSQELVYQGTISDDQDLYDLDEMQEVYDEGVESDEDGREFDYGG